MTVIIILKSQSLWLLCGGQPEGSGLRSPVQRLGHQTGASGPKQGSSQKETKEEEQREDTKAGGNKVTKARADKAFEKWE